MIRRAAGGRKTRSTAELIKELDGYASHFTQVCLIVEFEKRTENVWAGDADRKAKLDSLVSSGGEPIGMLGFSLDGMVLMVRTRPLEEYSTEPWVKDYLRALCEPVYQGLVESGAFNKDVAMKKPTDWIQ